jgi:hypothetical protein
MVNLSYNVKIQKNDLHRNEIDSYKVCNCLGIKLLLKRKEDSVQSLNNDVISLFISPGAVVWMH